MNTFDVEYYNYSLPPELIAQLPIEPRSSSRLLCLDRRTGECNHTQFSSISSQLNSNDLLIFNDTKVFPARLYGHKATGGKLECLIERVVSKTRALAHLRSSKSPSPGTHINLGKDLSAVVLGRQGELFELDFSLEHKSLIEVLWEQGEMPLPPYITRSPNSEDTDRYQTVFAQQVGAVAAPTAGLHFDHDTLQKLDDIGVRREFLTLHVGAGTFQPVRVDNINDHHMHAEWIHVPSSLCDAVMECKASGGRVVAVGTTVLRALESASLSGSLQSYKGETDIFIYPGFQFNCVDALLTNFHLPKSTLLMLVSAFAGRDHVMAAYEDAVRQRYRFFSYGDCMLIG